MTRTGARGGGGAGWGATALLSVLALLGGAAVSGAGAEPRLRVEYRPPVLTVEAAQVGVAEVLKAIGERVGFSIVEAGGPGPPVTLSVSGSLETILRHVLVGTSHALVYRNDAGGAGARIGDVERTSDIEMIVVLGPGSGGGGQAAAQGHARLAVAGGAEPRAGGVGGEATEKKTDRPSATVSETRATFDADPGSGPSTPTVSDLLREQALAMIPKPPDSEDAEGVAAPDPGPLQPQPPLTLAATVLRAQQGVQALVDALRAASAALAQSTRKAGH